MAMNPHKHVYLDACDLVPTPCMARCANFGERLAMVAQCPISSALQCDKCQKPCKPPVVDIDISGLPCTPFSTSGLRQGLEDPIIEIHLKWCLHQP